MHHLKLLTLLFILLPFSIWAQKRATFEKDPGYYDTLKARSSFEIIQLTGKEPVAAAMDYLQLQHPNFKSNGVKPVLKYMTQNQYGYYLLFEQHYFEIPVYNSYIKVNLDKELRITSIFDNSYNTATWSYYNLIAKRKSLQQKTIANIEKGTGVKTENNVVIYYDPVEAHPKVGIKSRVFDKNKLEHYEVLMNEQLQPVHQQDHNRYLVQDSVVKAFVFLPDPLTTAQTSYGGVYIDLNDADVAVLNDERKMVEMVVKFENGVFRLENDYVKIVERDAPATTPATSTVPVFDFTRAQPEFEDVNVYYHITEMQKYLQSLGFTLANYQIEVDAHAKNGEDNSNFTTSGPGTGFLLFGEGGVDDAEDADVIIHEYAHAISHSAAPYSNVGFERQAIDEGFSDYMAATYSRRLSEYAWDMVFTWDGHNEYWSGRTASSNKSLPYSSNSNIFDVGEIYSSALMEGWETLGGTVMDKIVLTSIFYFAPNMTLQDAGQALLVADQQVYNGVHIEELTLILMKRGLLGESKTGLFARNHFFHSNNNVIVTLGEEFSEADIYIYNIQGRLVYSKEKVNFRANVIPRNAFNATGVYLVEIRNEDQSHVEKFFWLDR